MCGIVGFWNCDGHVASEVLLERMLERIRHRGPDGKGTWTHGPVGLGHCRLSILDLSERGHQPFVTSDGLGVISYNGEVYNFRELRSELEKEGIQFRSSSDTEVVLYALHGWGPEKAVSLFNGMFAFAYYDLRGQTLWLGRDKAGIKPLYFSNRGGTVAFASEIKGLFGHPAVPCKPDMHALTTQLIHQRLDGTWTAFEGVQSLLPGTLMKITRNSEEVVTYFDLLRDLNIKRILDARKSKFESLVEEFDRLFAQSVQFHLVSDAPLATMSSGGLDSSLMTVWAKKYKSDIVAYVAEVEGIQVPELPRAQKVCRQLGVQLRPVKVGQEEYLRFWPTAVYQNDQPNYFAGNVPFALVARQASRDGFKVLLTGEGSDELFGGYPWQVDAYRMWRARQMHSRWIPNIGPIKFLGRFVSKLSPLDLSDLAKRPFTHMSQESYASGAIRELCAVDAGQRAFRGEAIFRALEGIASLGERAFLASSIEDFYCHLQNLLVSNDKMGMASSIEARVPFLENALIDFAFHLPCPAKFKKGMTKRIVKKAAEKYLPQDIVHARKIGFGVSSHVWRNLMDFLKGGMVEDLFKWKSSDRGALYGPLTRDHWVLFHLVSMELWARMYFRGESSSELGEELLRFRHKGKEVFKKTSAAEPKLYQELT